MENTEKRPIGEILPSDDYDLILAEKDQQAEDIAQALELTETSMEFTVPTTKYTDAVKKLTTPTKRLNGVRTKIAELQKRYEDRGKDISESKEFQKLKAKETEYIDKLNTVQDIVQKNEVGLKTKSIRYWVNHEKDIILMACTGHILDIEFTKNQTPYPLDYEGFKNLFIHNPFTETDTDNEDTDLDIDSEESESDDDTEDDPEDGEDKEESESDSNSEYDDSDLTEDDEMNFFSGRDCGLKFDTQLKLPSTQKKGRKKKDAGDDDGLINRYLRFQLIKFFVKDHKEKIGRLICATDYDREGQLIFGSVMTYFGIDLEDCHRMKFSTLEEDVLRDAYDNLIEFDTNLYNAGEARRWLDFIIGFNFNPIFSYIYKQYMNLYLKKIKFSPDDMEEFKMKVLGANSYNAGRVKVVILDYIFRHTKSQIDRVSEIENYDPEVKDTIKKSLYMVDGSNNDCYICDTTDHKSFTKFNPALDSIVLIDNVKEEIRDDDELGEIPSFLNMTKVFKLCEDLGASADEINKILEYLYLQKYTSYPRSKSEQWEVRDIDGNIDEDGRLAYAHGVLDMLNDIGYPVQDYYYDGYGNEGTQSHSHPCIHPLSNVDMDKVEILKKINPLAYMVFNKICIYTLQCFEKLARSKFQTIEFKVNQEGFSTTLTWNRRIELVEPNIANFNGNLYGKFSYPINVTVGNSYHTKIITQQKRDISLLTNHNDVTMYTDFDVINFLNENDIGTDATRTVMLSTLIQMKYIVSNKVLLTTFLGNQLKKITDAYMDFIDISYTLELEKDLNRIESGDMDIDEFKEQVQEHIVNTYQKILENPETFVELFNENPECETHGTKMVIAGGKFGKYMICLHSFDGKKCKNRFSL